MFLRETGFLPGSQVPLVQSAIEATAGKRLGVWRKGQGFDALPNPAPRRPHVPLRQRPIMERGVLPFTLGLTVVNHHGPIVPMPRRSNERLIARHGHGIERVPLDRLPFDLSGWQVPQAGVVARGGQVIIARERQAIYLALMAKQLTALLAGGKVPQSDSAGAIAG